MTRCCASSSSGSEVAKLIDLNILLYAANRDSVLHARAKAWLEEAVWSDEPVAVSWAGILGLLRLSTNRRLMPRPLDVPQAATLVDWLLETAAVQVLDPGTEHWRILRAGETARRSTPSD